MDKLKKLKIIAGLKLNQLIDFKNIEKIEDFNIDLDLENNLINYSSLSYFSKFPKLKTLKIGIRKLILFQNMKIPKLSLPDKLNSLNLSNILGKYILTLLRDNNNNLIDIEELKIINTNFKIDDYKSLIYLFNTFKSLKKLSLNKIYINNSKKDEYSDLFIVIDTDKNINDFYEQIPLILSNIPTLIELDVSNNKYNRRLFKSPIFENIRLSIPSKLLSLKIFNSDIPISQKIFNYLKESFGLVLDLDNNYPKIDREADTIDLIDELIYDL